MEEEVTKVSLSRYKLELDQKQRVLKTSQRYEEQLRDLRACFAYVLSSLEVDSCDLPDYLRDPMLASENTQ